MARIEIRGLTKRYTEGAMAAVHDLNLDIADNRFVTLLGPSGCGKTTTLRLIAGFVTPDAGTIAVDGQVLSSAEGVVPPERRGMGMVFQNYAVWPHKTVFENIAFGLEARRTQAGEIGTRVQRMLELVGLAGFERRLPSELSGGQQQRVALARSLVVEPSILLLDEPLSNLDAKLRERMRGELKELQRRTGITFVYVTHDQAEALALSDDIAVMDGGVVQQFGPPRQIYARPANRGVADFMGQVNFLPARLMAVTGETARVTLEGGPELSVLLPAGATVARMPAVGEMVDLAVRPENIRLAAAGARATPAGALAGRIADGTFLGNANEYVVTVGDDRRVRVQTHPSQQFAAGDSVTVEFDPTECTIFKPADMPGQ